MRAVIDSIEAEYRRYKALGEAAMAQLEDEELVRVPAGGGNSIATIVWHLSGNFRSRFTDFLTSDGEKPWRRRDEEFEARQVPRDEMIRRWESGWSALFTALGPLLDSDLSQTVTIRRQPFRVEQALHRSLAHAAYHVGQIVYAAKEMRGPGWRSLSIPIGQSEAANENPRHQSADEHIRSLSQRTSK